MIADEYCESLWKSLQWHLKIEVGNNKTKQNYSSLFIDLKGALWLLRIEDRALMVGATLFY